LYVRGQRSLQQAHGLEDIGIAEARELEWDREPLAERILLSERSDERPLEVEQPCLGLRNHQSVKGRQLSVRNGIAKIDPEQDILSKPDMIVAPKCFPDEVHHVPRVVLVGNVMIAPLAASSLDDSDRQAVPRHNEEHSE
jgi:hypothetical protein